MTDEYTPERRRAARTRHGHARVGGEKKCSPTYQSWLSMRSRVKYPSRHNHVRYAAVGVCESWRSFDAFLADMGERPNGKTLDRIDNDKGYSSSNCRWATPRQQARNTRRNVLTLETAIEVAEMRLSGATCREIAELYGISESLPREIVKGRTWPDALEAAWNRRAGQGGG